MNETNDKYILDESGNPMPEPDLMKWAQWFQEADGARHVAKDHIAGYMVSTVFLGLDHSHGGPVPLLYETMIFGGDLDQKCYRSTTRDEALLYHAGCVEAVQAEIAKFRRTCQEGSDG